MKFAITKKNINNVPKGTTEIHIVRPMKLKDVSKIITENNIKHVSMSKSTEQRMPKNTINYLKEKTEISIEARQGRPLEMGLEQMQKIIELKKDYQSIREIEKQTAVPKSTVHYLIKYADRAKIKTGEKIIYLK